MDAIIRAEKVVKRYDVLTAVAGVSFEVLEGECFGLLGPNGAGKTSLIKMIHCFYPLTEGHLHVLDLDVMRHGRRIKRQTGVVPQENNLDPELTVRNNLLVYARYFDLPRRKISGRVDELLDFMQLTEKRDARIRQLSGGMKRRLVLTRALLNDPKLLILDEPTTGLDPQARHQIWGRLRHLKSKGVTLLLTTHYMEEAAQLCDRVAIMDQGQILTCAPPADLVRDQVGDEVIELDGPEARSAEVQRTLGEGGFSHEWVGERLLIFGRKGANLFERFSQAGHTRLTHRPATLEDLFLRLTGRELRE